MQSEAPCPAEVSVITDGLVAETALPRTEDCHHPRLPLAGAEGQWESGVGCPEKYNISRKAQGLPQGIGPAPAMRPLTDKGQTLPLSTSCMARCIQKPTVAAPGAADPRWNWSPREKGSTGSGWRSAQPWEPALGGPAGPTSLGHGAGPLAAAGRLAAASSAWTWPTCEQLTEER